MLKKRVIEWHRDVPKVSILRRDPQVPKLQNVVFVVVVSSLNSSQSKTKGISWLKSVICTRRRALTRWFLDRFCLLIV